MATIDDIKKQLAQQKATNEQFLGLLSSGLVNLQKKDGKYYLPVGESQVEVPKSLVQDVTEQYQLDNLGVGQPGAYARGLDLYNNLYANQQGNYNTGTKAIREALQNGLDLSGLGYGQDYYSSSQFLKDVGGKANSKDDAFLPANPVGYSGGYKFDPNFGSQYYRELAMQAGQALGLTPEQILKTGSNYTLEQLYDPSGRKGAIGFNDLGKGLIDRLAIAAGVDQSKLSELQQTTLKPLYDANANLYQNLNNAAKIESNSSGFFKQIGQDIAKLGPIGTIALTTALGPAGAGLSTALAAGTAAAIPGLLQGDIGGGIKSGLLAGGLAGLGTGAFKSIGDKVSGAFGGGALGNVASNSALGALRGGIQSGVTGGNIGQGALTGGLLGGVSSGVNQALSSLLGPGVLSNALAGGLTGAIGASLIPKTNVQMPANQANNPVTAVSNNLAMPVNSPSGTGLAVQKYSISPETSQYQGDFSKYGQTALNGFQFYKPNLSLLG